MKASWSSVSPVALIVALCLFALATSAIDANLTQPKLEVPQQSPLGNDSIDATQYAIEDTRQAYQSPWLSPGVSVSALDIGLAHFTIGNSLFLPSSNDNITSDASDPGPDSTELIL